MSVVIADSVRQDDPHSLCDQLGCTSLFRAEWKSATTVVGRPVDAEFTARMELGSPLNTTYRLALLVEQRDGQESVIHASAAFNVRTGKACFQADDWKNINWRPETRDVVWQFNRPCVTEPPISTANDNPTVYAAIIDMRAERPEYQGYHCPADLRDCAIPSEIYIQNGAVRRYLGKSLSSDDQRMLSASGEDASGKFLRFRYLGRHAPIKPRGGRFLAILEPTEDGYVFLQWKRAYRGGPVCFPKNLLDNYGGQLELGEADDDGARCVKDD